MKTRYQKGLSKSSEKRIRMLRNKKHRESSGEFIAEGVKLAEELMRSPHIRVHSVFAREEFFESHPVRDPGTECFVVSEKELGRVSYLDTPNQVLVCAGIPVTTVDLDALGNSWIPVLDDVRDPGNLGTILRAADWFGMGTVVCSESTVDAYNPKVIQATMGSIARVRIQYCNLENFLDDYKARFRNPVYGTFLSGDTLYGGLNEKAGIFIIGNESRGISEVLEKRVDRKIFIPGFQAGPHLPESLNAAVTAAVISYEIRRKKAVLFPGKK